MRSKLRTAFGWFAPYLQGVHTSAGCMHCQQDPPQATAKCSLHLTAYHRLSTAAVHAHVCQLHACAARLAQSSSVHWSEMQLLEVEASLRTTMGYLGSMWHCFGHNVCLQVAAMQLVADTHCMWLLVLHSCAAHPHPAGKVSSGCKAERVC